MAGALVLFLLSSPILLLAAVAVAVTTGRPVLFRQKRAGLRGEPFTIVKFRTMTDMRDNDGKLLPDGDRLTRVGRVLRKTSIDELPELWNVLRGDMSLVGPRPLYENYLPYYRGIERARLDARPGITGLAQVSGRNLIPWDERLALDAEYVANVSLGLDMRILLKTAWMTVTGFGVSVDTLRAELSLDQERRET
jgi:lipopolysaccharide/colanic/teichoic acid biosynthesis glycosyltransferase